MTIRMLEMMDKPHFFFILLGVAAFLYLAIKLIPFMVTTIRYQRKNNRAEILTVEVTIVEKIKRTTQNCPKEDMGVTVIDVPWVYEYFIICEVASGDRLELEIDWKLYDTVSEGQHGDLTYQGNRFIEFVRNQDDG